MSGVSLSKVVKRYGALEVVHGIDLEIQPREFVVLVGPSGCGKSTTLRMIAGLEEISDGTVTIGDRVVNKVAPKDRDVAMVFQNYALYPHLSVADNIAFGLKLRRVKKAEIQSSVTEVAATLGLTDYLERRPADLSGGQRQRVAMGRAIVRHPEVFLFDEPLSNLDAKLRTQMRAEIKRLHKRLGVTSIYVTHDQVEAMTLADRIVVMQDGRIEQIGAPMDLFNNPVNTFVAGFIGSPPMNQMPGRLRLNADGPSVVLTDGQVLKLAPDARLEAAIVGGDGRKLIVGIRPEHAQIIPVKGMNTLKIDVDLVEPLGSEALVHGHVADLPFVAKVETHGRIDGLDHVTELSIDPAQIKLFSAETGRALGHAMDDHLPSAFAATGDATATGAKNAVAT